MENSFFPSPLDTPPQSLPTSFKGIDNDLQSSLGGTNPSPQSLPVDNMIANSFFPIPPDTQEQLPPTSFKGIDNDAQSFFPASFGDVNPFSSTSLNSFPTSLGGITNPQYLFNKPNISPLGLDSEYSF